MMQPSQPPPSAKKIQGGPPAPNPVDQMNSQVATLAGIANTDALYDNMLNMPPPLRNRVVQQRAFQQGRTQPIEIPRRGQLNGQG